MNLEERVKKIEDRNKKVELDKTWETCWTRRVCIMVLTYIVVIIYSYLVKQYDSIFLTSLVPVIGFTLSTLSLKIVRKIWENKKININQCLFFYICNIIFFKITNVLCLSF